MLTYESITAAQLKHEELTAVRQRPEIPPVVVTEPGLFDRVRAAFQTAFARKPATRQRPEMRRSLATE